VLTVNHDEDVGLLTVVVESAPGPMGCGVCGVIAHSHGRRDVALVDAPCFGRLVRLTWGKRSWRCAEPSCPTRVFTEQDQDVAAPRALMTTRACWWAINQLRREHARISGIAANSVGPGTRCGPRSGHCWRRWPTTSPGSPA